MDEDRNDIWQHVKTGGLYQIEDRNALIEADLTSPLDVVEE